MIGFEDYRFREDGKTGGSGYPLFEDEGRAVIVTFTNVKGGVGKTTTAVNLAAAFAGAGLRTLMVDLDPQAAATASLGLKEDGSSVADVLLRDAAVADAARPSAVEKLDVLAGSSELSGADLVLARKRDPEQRLAQALRRSRRWDVIVIDSPPGLSLLPLLGLAAADAYVLPTTPQRLSVDALGKFERGLEQVRGSLRRMPVRLGVLLTMVDHRTAVTDELVAEVRKRWGRDVFHTEIPLNISLAVAPGSGRSIFDHEAWSSGGRAYRKLGGEVLRRARRRELL
jgi:chromosome partitioning protein